MAKRKKRKISYRKRSRSTRKGQARKTARRAYTGTRRRARRNPKPLLQQPSIRYVAWGSVGAGLGLAVESSGLLKQIDNLWARSAIAAALTGLLAGMLKGRAKSNGMAVAAGMLIPPIAGAISDAVAPAFGQLSLPGGNGNGTSTAELAARRARIAARPNPHAAAQAHAVAARKNVLA
jgi:hypothetical protein